MRDSQDSRMAMIGWRGPRACVTTALVSAWSLGACAAEHGELDKAIAQLSSTNWEERHTATTVIAGMGTAARKALPQLRGRLYDSKPIVRRGAIEALAAMGPHAIDAASEMIQCCLGYDDLPLHTAATAALVAIGPATIPVLVSAPVEAYESELADDLSVGKGDAELRAWDKMLEVIGQVADPLGRMATDAMPALVAGLAAADPRTREVAAHLVGRMGRHASSGVSALAGALSDADTNVRIAATRALARIGLDAREAAPALRDALRDARLQHEAALALRAIEERPK